MRERRLVVGITGASGSIYAARFLAAAVDYYDEIYLTITENGRSVMRWELGIELGKDASVLLGERGKKVHVLPVDDLSAPPASGSFQYEGMVIIPCSMGTVGRIAGGISNDLVSRVADVCLKEGRRLVLVVREAPLNLVHLRNLTSLAEAGAVILPACPGFYTRPQGIEDMVSFVVGKTLQQLGIEGVMEWENVGK